MNSYEDEIAIIVSSTCKRDLQYQFDTNKQSHFTFNMRKMKAMFCGMHHMIRKTDDIKISHMGSDIESVEKYKYLGVIPNQYLKFDQHVKYVKDKCIGIFQDYGNQRQIIGPEGSINLFRMIICPPVIHDCLRSTG